MIAYNAVDKEIMTRNKIAIDDLYAFALPKLKEIQRPANVHFLPEGSKVLADQVAKAIQKALADTPLGFPSKETKKPSVLYDLYGSSPTSV